MNNIDAGLLEPFKSEDTYTVKTSDGKSLTHLKARVIEARLNDVLGLDWGHRVVPSGDGQPFSTVEYSEAGIQVVDMVVIVELTIGSSSRQGIGTKRIDETSGIPWADYAKMAENNAIFKAANKFGIGMDLYGETSTSAPAQATSKGKTVRNPNDPATEPQMKTIRKMEKWRLDDDIRSDVEDLVARMDNGETITKGEASAVMDANQASKG